MRILPMFGPLLGILLGAASSLAHAQQKPAQETTVATDADTAAIRQTALDYIDGWYTGDAERMERALHPQLAKRIVATDPRSGRSHLVVTSALELVQQTRAGVGKQTPLAERRSDVRILDRFGNTAMVRVDASGWIDYMQMARYDGRWVIVNVLWETRPEK